MATRRSSQTSESFQEDNSQINIDLRKLTRRRFKNQHRFLKLNERPPRTIRKSA
ncbi:hypothetical protein COLO4_32745 [Corchorus olitorius]|uniref:Uncharacterized protein n=1 Tax=Corchorus olitorius TaxID=93759 RepID=A0A1R3GY81_9ROSI|nr:hypothetical protein COLO4_32745 [Corchorus olitorius]